MISILRCIKVRTFMHPWSCDQVRLSWASCSYCSECLQQLFPTLYCHQKTRHSVFRWTQYTIYGFVFCNSVTTMPGKWKKAQLPTLSHQRKMTRKPADKPQPLPISSSPSHELLNVTDYSSHKEETHSSGLMRVIDLLMDIASHLEATKHGWKC